MIWVLSAIFLLLLVTLDIKRGFKTFLLFYTSFVLIALYILLMKWGFNALIVSFVICGIVSLFNLFGLNGVNIKTKSSLISIMCVLLLISLLIIIICMPANVQGFSTDSIESIGGFSYEINYNMNYVLVGVYLVSAIGTMIDTSMAISSALWEVFENNPHLSKKELFNSGINIGKDILCTTINTLYFAVISFFIGFFLWHHNESIELILNYKSLIQEVIKLLVCIIGSIAIIPVTSFIFPSFVSRND